MHSQQIQTRKVNDVIYGFTYLERKYWHFIDTVEFQRLRRIKKLGCLQYVFPCATHSVFQHSLGAAYLGKQFIENLITNNPEAYQFGKDQIQKITQVKDSFILACLLKNLGAAPFGRVFHQFANEILISQQRDLISQQRENNKQVQYIDRNLWSQQTASIVIFQSMLKTYPKLSEEFGSIKQRIRILIKGEKKMPEISNNSDKKISQQNHSTSDTRLQPQPPKLEKINQQNIYYQRPWQIQLVNNKQGGISIDNLQSFRRDSKYLGATQIFIDNQLLMKEARIIKNKAGDWHHTVCYPAKHIETIYNFFDSRYALSREFYFNKISCGIELVILDIFRELSKKSEIPSIRNNYELLTKIAEKQAVNFARFNFRKLINIQDDITEYLKLSDNILSRIQFIHGKNKGKNKKTDELQKAKDLIKKYTNYPLQQNIQKFEKLASEGKEFDKIQANKQKTSEISELISSMHILMQQEQDKKIQNAVLLINKIKYREVYKFVAQSAYYISVKNNAKTYMQHILSEQQLSQFNSQLVGSLKQEDAIEKYITRFIIRQIKQQLSAQNIRKNIIIEKQGVIENTDITLKINNISQKIRVDVQDGIFGTAYLNPIQKVCLIQRKSPKSTQWKILKQKDLDGLGKRYQGVSVENSIKIYIDDNQFEQYYENPDLQNAKKELLDTETVLKNTNNQLKETKAQLQKQHEILKKDEIQKINGKLQKTQTELKQVTAKIKQNNTNIQKKMAIDSILNRIKIFNQQIIKKSQNWPVKIEFYYGRAALDSTPGKHYTPSKQEQQKRDYRQVNNEANKKASQFQLEEKK